MKIDLLYFDGCPSWERGLANLQAALAAEKISSDIHLIEVKDDTEAAREKFLGSPSFRINGQDLWPEERRRYTMNCRVYATDKGLQGYPTPEMFREKVRAFLNNLPGPI